MRVAEESLDGIRQYRRDLVAAWGEFHTEPDRIVDVDDQRVLHLYRIVGRGRSSGTPTEQDIAVLWCLREGRLRRGDVYPDQADALRAAGLQ